MTSTDFRRKTNWWLAVAAALLIGGVLWLTSIWSQDYFLSQVRDRARHTLDLHIANLEGFLEKYQVLPGLFARNDQVVRFLLNPKDINELTRTNHYMEVINRLTGASDTYLMDKSGLTIAASNWNSERPFIGRNFSFRPYFQQAMAGKLGRYFALGTTSNKRGYYFAYPVQVGTDTLGVVVVKVSTAEIEEAWAKGSDAIIVTDTNGVIFLSSIPQWKFKTLQPLDPQTLERIKLSRQYGNSKLNPLPLGPQGSGGDDVERMRIRQEVAGKSPRTVNYLVQSALMPEAGWIVHILSPTAPVNTQVVAALVFAGGFLVFILLIGVYLLQRRRNLRDRMDLQRESQQALEEAYGELEQRVQERTRDLKLSNVRLQQEMQERQRAEQELIQAGKLAALGQMSAGISHELNQPLAAIRSYAENAHLLLDSERTGEARENLSLIATLTGRMAQIIGHLKTFAHKKSTDVMPVSLPVSLEETLRIFEERFKQQSIDVAVSGWDEDIFVYAEPVRLQQVFVNLIGNALDAMQGNGGKKIQIDARHTSDTSLLTFTDTGPGISTDLLTQVFDPFFTTKEVGKGLGLGLSISYSIIREFGGVLRAANGADGGAVFTIELQRAEATKRATG